MTLTPCLELARTIAARGAPYGLDEVAVMRGAANLAHFSPATNDRDAVIDRALSSIFGAPWRLRLAQLSADFAPQTREEFEACAQLAHDDWRALGAMYDALPEGVHDEAREEVARRRDNAQARHRDYSAQLTRLTSGLIGAQMPGSHTIGGG